MQSSKSLYLQCLARGRSAYSICWVNEQMVEEEAQKESRLEA